MLHIQEKKYCCGCEACIQVCPRHCISFNEDDEGFNYPQIDKSKCIDCGLCEKVCPVLNQVEPQKPLFVYAAKNTNTEELLKSSSGGIFILLAKTVLNQGGVVFGAKFDKDWNVIHAYAETEEEVKKFMGSKYVQSRTGNSYSQAKKFLERGRKVLFSGTSCQIAGLKYFLRKDYDNLLTVDVICHGVPSPKVWRRYLNEIKNNVCKKEKRTFYFQNHLNFRKNLSTYRDVQIERVSFRDKETGWKKFSLSYTLTETSVQGNKNSVTISHLFHEDPYMKLFLRNFILRPSCYQCPAKNGKSQSDLTIADFWGIEKSHPDFDDERGVGLMMVNSDKGLQAMSSLHLKLKKVSLTDAISSNPVYIHPVKEPYKREQCFRLLNFSNKSLDKVIEALDRPPFVIRVKQRIKGLLRFIIIHH